MLAQVFKSADALARAAVACVYAIPVGAPWGLPADMLTAVKHAIEGGETDAPSAAQHDDAQHDSEHYQTIERLEQVCSQLITCSILGTESQQPVQARPIDQFTVQQAYRQELFNAA